MSGTQAENTIDNHIVVSKMFALHKTQYDDDPEEAEPENYDEDAKINYDTIAHQGAINRIRVGWSELSILSILSILIVDVTTSACPIALRLSVVGLTRGLSVSTTSPLSWLLWRVVTALVTRRMSTVLCSNSKVIAQRDMPWTGAVVRRESLPLETVLDIFMYMLPLSLVGLWIALPS